MPFHIIPKSFRNCIKFQAPNNKFYNIKELFDLKCCFVQLAADLAIQQTQDPELITEFKRVKTTAENDIYTDILKYTKSTTLSRNDFKPYIMYWLFSNSVERQSMIKSKKHSLIKLIDEYFNFKFPNFHKFITKYQLTRNKQKIKSNTKSKLISKLSLDCFKKEANLIFNKSNRFT